MSSSKLRIGLVGAGSMGALHARVIAGHDACELSWVADPAIESAESLVARFGGVALAEPDLAKLDAVVVASPTETHYSVAREILEAGMPLLLEKPVTDNLGTSQSLVDLATRLKVPFMCGFLERFNPAVRTAFSIASEPLQLSAIRHSPYVERIKTGVAWDLAIHDVDLALRLFDEPVATVSAVMGHVHPLGRAGSEDTVEVLFSTESGRIADLSASRISQRKIRSLTIVELNRMIEVDLLRQDITIYRHLGIDLTEVDGLGYRQQSIMEVPVIRFPGEPLALQLSHFVDLIEGRIDMEVERMSVLPAHEIVDRAMRSVIG